MLLPGNGGGPRRSLGALCFGLPLVLFGAACATAPSTKTSAVSALGPPEPSVIDRATELFYRGKDSALSGDFTCAEAEFQEALDIVAAAGQGSGGGAELDEFSQSLYQSILRYDAMAQSAAELEPAEGRGAPDELLGVSGQASPDELARARQQIGTDERAATFDIPITVNEAVISMVATFISRDSVRQRFAEGLGRAGRYMPMIRSIFQREGLPEDLAYVAMIESSFKTNAHSRARAHGVWQFITSTGRRYGLKSNRILDERSDPVKSTEAAARYFRDLYDIFDDWYLAMAAYDSGEGRVARAMSRAGSDSYWDLCRAGALPKETRLYVPSVIAAALIAKNPAHYGFAVDSAPPIAFETIALSKPLSLKRLSAAAGVSYAALKDLNPELKTDVTPRLAGGYALRVPPGAAAALQARLDVLPAAAPPSLGRQHRVRKGETLARLARRFGVSLASLAEANDLSPHAWLAPRTVLTIPDREPPVRHASKKHHAKVRKKTPKRVAQRVDIPSGGITEVASALPAPSPAHRDPSKTAPPTP